MTYTKGANMSNVDILFPVKIERYSNGFIATSKGYKGLFASAPTYEKLLTSISGAIRVFLKMEHGTDYRVIKKEDSGLAEDTAPAGEVTFFAKAA